MFAHPDDAEFLSAGTLAHLADRGAKIHIATMTAGDCGSTKLPGAKIAQTRRREATESARIIGARYVCVGEKDLSVFYDRRTLAKVLELVRQVDPTLVFTHSPTDYMVDHENASRLCQTACFGALAPNYHTGFRKAAKAVVGVPHLYYAQPFGGRDILGNKIASRVFVDVTLTYERKQKMLASHKSQRDWLRSHQEIDDPLVVLRQMSEQAGKACGFQKAEGFRQHLGQGFPQDDLLGKMLGKLVQRRGK